MTVKHIATAVGALLLSGAARIPAQQSFCEEWSFSKGDAGPGADASGWEKPNLPHIWNAQDGGGRDNHSRDGDYRGPGWYRKNFHADESLRGLLLFVRYEGVGSVADVYLNGRPVGRHMGAFGAFFLELTKQVEVAAENELRVRRSGGGLAGHQARCNRHGSRAGHRFHSRPGRGNH